MTIKIRTSIQRSERVPADVDAIYTLLKPVESAARFFPRVERIQSLGDQCYAWTLEPMGTQKYRHQVEYVSQWDFDDASRIIRWRPVNDRGNARISGVWAIHPASGLSRIELEIKAELRLDLPRWMQMVAEPIVQTEFQKILNQYFDNVVQHCRTLEPAVS